MEEFLTNVQLMGIEIKERGGLSFKLPNSKKPIRLSSLKDKRYDSIEAIQLRIENETPNGNVMSIEEIKQLILGNLNHEPILAPKVANSKPIGRYVGFYDKDYWKNINDNLLAIDDMAEKWLLLLDYKIENFDCMDQVIQEKVSEINLIKRKTTVLENKYKEYVKKFSKRTNSVVRIKKK